MSDESNISDEEFKKILVSTLHEIDLSNKDIAQNMLEIKAIFKRVEKYLKKVLK